MPETLAVTRYPPQQTASLRHTKLKTYGLSFHMIAIIRRPVKAPVSATGCNDPRRFPELADKGRGGLPMKMTALCG